MGHEAPTPHSPSYRSPATTVETGTTLLEVMLSLPSW